MLTTKTGTTATCTWGGFLTALTGFEVGVGSSTSSEFSYSAFSPILGFVPCFTASSSREPMSSFFTCTTTREFTFRRIFSLTSQCQCSPFCSPAPSRRDRAPQAQQQHQAFYPRPSPDRERINSRESRAPLKSQSIPLSTAGAGWQGGAQAPCILAFASCKAGGEGNIFRFHHLVLLTCRWQEYL